MKKILVTFFSAIIAFSFSAGVLSANHIAPSSEKITKQVIRSDGEPIPAPDPVPAPAPTPAPEPEPK